MSKDTTIVSLPQYPIGAQGEPCRAGLNLSTHTVPVEAFQKLGSLPESAYWPDVARKLKSLSASALIRYLWKQSPRDGFDGWIPRTYHQIESATGLNRWEQRTARKVLIKSGVLSEKRIEHGARLYFKIGWRALAALILDVVICTSDVQNDTSDVQNDTSDTDQLNPGSPSPDWFSTIQNPESSYQALTRWMEKEGISEALIKPLAYEIASRAYPKPIAKLKKWCLEELAKQPASVLASDGKRKPRNSVEEAGF